MSDKDKRLTAYHEAGHAIVSRFLETQKDIKEVSIIPRGVAGGYTMYKTNEDKYYVSKTEMLEKLIALLGGRASEKLILNDVSTGASNDFEVATDIILLYIQCKPRKRTIPDANIWRINRKRNRKRSKTSNR